MAEAGDEKKDQESVWPLKDVRWRLSQLAAEQASRQVLKPERLHELRIQLKLLRYQAELAGDTPQQERLIAELKSVQDLIGEWHDWEMLAQSAEKHFRDRLNCALLVEIRSLLAVRYASACSAATGFLNAYAPAMRKRPASVAPPKALTA